MLKVTYIQPGGSRTTIEVEAGTSIMQGAWSNLVPGIEAQCGGACSCATCHVYVDERWVSQLPVLGQDENGLLEGVACERQLGSRLSCQVLMSDALDGIEVHIPESQG